MGPSMALLGGSILWMVILCVVIVVGGFVINKLWMYRGPEDDEEWQENEDDNFKIH